MRKPAALFTASAVILVAAATMAVAQSTAPSRVKPIVPVPPSNAGVPYPGTVTICHRVCMKTRRPNAAAAPVCVQWQTVC